MKTLRSVVMASFFAIIARYLVILIAYFAKFATLVDVTISWICVRSLSSEWKRDIVVILKSSYIELRATIGIILS